MIQSHGLIGTRFPDIKIDQIDFRKEHTRDACTFRYMGDLPVAFRTGGIWRLKGSDFTHLDASANPMVRFLHYGYHHVDSKDVAMFARG